MPSCFSCGKELPLQDRIGRGESCPGCGADLHCCRNCGFYDPKVYNECREPMAERVIEKDRSNFCDYFQLVDRSCGGSSQASEAKKKLDALFKKKGP